MTDISGNVREDVVLAMEGSLTVERSMELKEKLLNALEDSASVTIRFHENSRIDVSFFQLMCAAHRSALGSRKQLTVVHPFPENLMKEIRSAGYVHHPVWDVTSNTVSVRNQGGNNE